MRKSRVGQGICPKSARTIGGRGAEASSQSVASSPGETLNLPMSLPMSAQLEEIFRVLGQPD
jgi:hypothetical protein